MNLGCGSRYHPSWVNIDISSKGPDVLVHDLSSGIPLEDSSCTVVYSAAMLEHLRLDDIAAFLGECMRVMQPGGILRVGVPDLEAICRLYLDKLEAACAGDHVAAHDHKWLLLEMYDQTAREKGGGAMIDYLRQDPLPNEEFIYQRIGEEGRQLVMRLRQQRTHGASIPSFSFRSLIASLLRNISSHFRSMLLRTLIGSDGLRALEIGQFRLKGEVHHSAFDRYSLAKLLLESGFRQPRVMAAGESQIPDFSQFGLDTLSDGRPIKPDLFFMEAIK